MPATSYVPSSFAPGAQLIDGSQLNFQLPRLHFSSTVGIVATPAGTQATSIALTTVYNNVETVASANDGVLLTQAIPGRQRIVFNNGANALKVFGLGNDTVDGVAGATGVALANAKRCGYYCLEPGKWLSAQLGAVSA